MVSTGYLLFFPLVCAFIGWGTNYLAVRMLFRPHQPARFGPFRFQGLIPRRRREVAGNIARTVEEELLCVDDLSAVLERSIDWEEKIEEKIDRIVEEKLHIELWQKLPLWDRFAEKVALPLKKLLRRELARLILGLQAELIANFRRNLDLHKLVYERIDRFDLRQLEDVVLKVASQELRHIELLGAVLGFVIGAVQVAVMLFFAG